MGERFDALKGMLDEQGIKLIDCSITQEEGCFRVVKLKVKCPDSKPETHNVALETLHGWLTQIGMLGDFELELRCYPSSSWLRDITRKTEDYENGVPMLILLKNTATKDNYRCTMCEERVPRALGIINECCTTILCKDCSSEGIRLLGLHDDETKEPAHDT